MKRIVAGSWLLALCLSGCFPEENVGASGTGSGGSSPRGSGGATGSGGAPGNGGAGGGLPCDVAAVLKAKCQGCHAATPLSGAPMSLLTYADTQAPAPSSASTPVWKSMQVRVHSTTMTVMPPRGQPSLTSAELATLDGWFAAGAPAGTQACPGGGGGTGGASGGGSGGSLVGTGGGSPGGTGGAGEGIGPQFLPCTPNRVLRAHAAGSTTAKYPVPNPTNDAYVCFNFKSPFAPGEQATAWAPIIDDARVVHHWILYGTNSALTDGSISNNCSASTLAATHVTGWAPGGGNSVLPSDVGLVLDYQSFQLQIHYNNQRYADAADATGIAFCSTTTPRQNAAGIVTLGTMLFSIPANANDYPVNTDCTSLAADGTTPITVLSTSPHMHLLGTGFRTQHRRGATTMGDLANIPLGTWSFDDQRHYPVDRRQVLPGDTLHTTCYYDNPSPSAVGFGTKTSDEMCFNFITVFPYSAANKRCPILF
jgi:hypothetical protein